MPRSDEPIADAACVTRRKALFAGGAALGGLFSATRFGWADDAAKPTRFLLACMTLPYSQFPLQRSLAGIKAAGFEYVAWGISHKDRPDGPSTPFLPHDAPPTQAKELASRCRDLGLEPVMMFSETYPEDETAPKIFPNRIAQAAAGGVRQLLTFGHTKGGNRKLWVERFKKWGPMASDQGVMIVVKQHGGETGTGAACAEIVREVDHDAIRVNYDAGNVMDYLNLDPQPDIRQCADVVHSFCIKDHRNFPRDEDCGPGLGEIDHYRLLDPVAWTGRDMPLCFENIFAPVVPRPTAAEGVDALARRAREFLEVVIAGLQSKRDEK